MSLFSKSTFMGALTLIAGVAAPSVYAGCSQGNDDQVVVYTDMNCQGRSFSFQINGTDELSFRDDWNDEVTSLWVGKNVKLTGWKDSVFRGDSVEFWPGIYNNVGGNWSDEISSYRIERIPNPQQKSVILFDNSLEQANSDQALMRLGIGTYSINDSDPKLTLNDEISSIEVPPGLIVTLYQGDHGEGHSYTFDKPGRYNTAPYDLHDNVTSIRVEGVSLELIRVESWKKPLISKSQEHKRLGSVLTCKASKEQRNPSDCSQRLERSFEESHEFAWSTDTSVTVGVSVTTAAGANVQIAEASTEITVSSEISQAFGTSTTNSSTESETFEVSANFSADPGETLEGGLYVTPAEITFYPRYVYRNTATGQETTRDGTIKTKAAIDATFESRRIAYDAPESETQTATTAPTSATAASSFLTGYRTGEPMTTNVKYKTRDGQYALVYQDDGNLVVYDRNGGFIWGSFNSMKIPLEPNARPQLTEGGLLVMRGQNGITRLSSQYGKDAVLAISSGQLQVVNRNTGEVYWAAPR